LSSSFGLSVMNYPDFLPVQLQSASPTYHPIMIVATKDIPGDLQIHADSSKWGRNFLQTWQTDRYRLDRSHPLLIGDPIESDSDTSGMMSLSDGEIVSN